MKIDPKSLAELKREAEKIPPQRQQRAEQNRTKLLRAVARLEKEQADEARGQNGQK
jgi:hypothetical protein